MKLFKVITNMSLIKSFFKSTKKLHFGRFDINTTEKQKISKMILANADNCGDIICGEPKIVKNLIQNENYPEFTIYREKNLDNPEFCCMFYNFKKCDSCILDK